MSLVDAVAASCAVPGVWPPVTVDGRRYIDGGVRSGENADLASGFGTITVLSPLGSESPIPSPMPLRDVVARLRSDGSMVTVIEPDEASRVAISANPLDPATRAPAAHAGRAQGRAGILKADTNSLSRTAVARLTHASASPHAAPEPVRTGSSDYRGRLPPQIGGVTAHDPDRS